ncbi:hypothetical protein [Micromonospora deserti]|uniref:hypothetical protein n=1 Tax=Micromonospora deserti TaxID=2070366 RepID=UPI001314C7DA|nr:hypothetical protein [Micromonospora deserti]
MVADLDARRVAVLAELERTGFRQLRCRVVFEPAAGPLSGSATASGSAVAAGP